LSKTFNVTDDQFCNDWYAFLKQKYVIAKLWKNFLQQKYLQKPGRRKNSPPEVDTVLRPGRRQSRSCYEFLIKLKADTLQNVYEEMVSLMAIGTV